VSVLNRNVQVNADGSWVLPNIPANFGQVKARATCVQNGITTFGESAFFTVAQTSGEPPHYRSRRSYADSGFAQRRAGLPVFYCRRQTIQLVVTATYPDNPRKT